MSFTCIYASRNNRFPRAEAKRLPAPLYAGLELNEKTVINRRTTPGILQPERNAVSSLPQSFIQRVGNLVQKCSNVRAEVQCPCTSVAAACVSKSCGCWWEEFTRAVTIVTVVSLKGSREVYKLRYNRAMPINIVNVVNVVKA